MKTKSDEHLKIWELALLLALCVTFLTALWAEREQHELSTQLVRLHVIAESDSGEDQAVKLLVRDAVLNHLTPRLEAAKTVSAATQVIDSELPTLRSLAEGVLRENGHDPRAAASLGVESYPTRYYEGFSLPAGDYLSLRIILGEGSGRNWWCVVFPPLCMATAEDEAAFSRLSEESRALILEEDSGYKIKFRFIEWYEYLKKLFAK